MEATRALRVLLADDHPMFRAGLRAVIDAMVEAEVVGEADTGEGAVEAAARLRPDVVVMDVQMPELNGIDATRRITKANPGVGVLVLTMFEDDESVFAAMRAGARGYLLKESSRAEIQHAVRAVAAGDTIFGPSAARRVLAFLSGSAGPRPSPFPQLTEREREVLDLMASGLGNSAIARRLALSDKTIRNHVSNVFTKLQVADRAEAIVRAREAGLGDEGLRSG